MKTITNYIDDLYNKFGSDYKTAQELGVNKELIYQVRKRGKCSDETALKIAKALEMEPDEILIRAAIERSSDDVKNAWENISRKAGIAASIYLAVGYEHPTLLNDLSEGFNAFTAYYVKFRNEKNKLKFMGLFNWVKNEFLLLTKRSRIDKETSSHFI